MALKRIGQKLMDTALDGAKLSTRAATRLIDDVGDTARVGKRLAGQAADTGMTLGRRARTEVTEAAQRGTSRVAGAVRPYVDEAQALRSRMSQAGSIKRTNLNNKANSLLDSMGAEGRDLKKSGSELFKTIREENLSPAANQSLGARIKGYSDAAGGPSSKAFREAGVQNELFDLKNKQLSVKGNLPRSTSEALSSAPMRAQTELPGGGNTGPRPGSSRDSKATGKVTQGSNLTGEQAGANLGAFAGDSINNFLDTGGFRRMAKSAGKGAVAGALTMGATSSLTGGDFWEGAGKGAMVGGLAGGIRGGIRQSSGAPEGTGTIDSIRHMNQRGNVSESVRTLMKSQESAAQAMNVIRGGGKVSI